MSLAKRTAALLAIGLLALLPGFRHVRASGGEVLVAEPAFGSPQPVEIIGLPTGAFGTPISTEEPFVSRDGRFLFFNSSREEGGKDLHFAERTAQGWRYRGEIGPGVNDPASVQGNPTMDREGRFFYVDSRSDVMVRSGRFHPDGSLTEVADVPGLPRRRVRPWRGLVEGTMGVEVSADGALLFFSRATWKLRAGRVGRLLDSDLGVALRRGDGFVFDREASRRILERVNTAAPEYAACLSADGLELFFTRLDPKSLGSGRVRSSLMHALRSSPDEPFGPPHRIASVGSDHFVEAPTLSPDGLVLYYHQRVGRKFRLFRVVRERRPFSGTGGPRPRAVRPACGPGLARGAGLLLSSVPSFQQTRQTRLAHEVSMDRAPWCSQALAPSLGDWPGAAVPLR